MVDGKLHEAVTSTAAGEHPWQMGFTWNWTLIEVRDAQIPDRRHQSNLLTVLPLVDGNQKGGSVTRP